MTWTPTAYAPAPALLASLERAGWGELRGREFGAVRATLSALVRSLPYSSAQGTTTAPQIADRAGYSERWVRRCLVVLEELGVIVWTRGGAVEGEPVPSFIRIVKSVLVDLIAAARPEQDAREHERARRVRERIAHLRYVLDKGLRSRRSVHAELSGSLPTPRGEDFRPASSPEASNTYIATTCEHGGDASRLPNGQPRCPSCRRAEAA
jgi:predicted transcriptional regulator